METNFKPLGDRVLVKPEQVEQKSKGVIYSKDEATNKIKLGEEEYLLFREHELIGIISSTVSL